MALVIVPIVLFKRRDGGVITTETARPAAGTATRGTAS